MVLTACSAGSFFRSLGSPALRATRELACLHCCPTPHNHSRQPRARRAQLAHLSRGPGEQTGGGGESMRQCKPWGWGGMAQHAHRPRNLQVMPLEKPGGWRNAGKRIRSQGQTRAQTPRALPPASPKISKPRTLGPSAPEMKRKHRHMHRHRHRHRHRHLEHVVHRLQSLKSHPQAQRSVNPILAPPSMKHRHRDR